MEDRVGRESRICKRKKNNKVKSGEKYEIRMNFHRQDQEKKQKCGVINLFGVIHRYEQEIEREKERKREHEEMMAKGRRRINA